MIMQNYFFYSLRLFIATVSQVPFYAILEGFFYGDSLC